MFYSSWGLNFNTFGITNPYMSFGSLRMYCPADRYVMPESYFGSANPFMLNSFMFNPYMMRFNMMQSMINSMFNSVFNHGCNCQHNNVQTVSVNEIELPRSLNTAAITETSTVQNNVPKKSLENRFAIVEENAENIFNQNYKVNSDNIFARKRNVFTATVNKKSSSVKTSKSGTSLSNVGKAASSTPINTLYKGTAADLDKHLKGVLKGKGETFLKAQKEYGINAAVLAAISIHETGNGSSNLAKTKNNVGGIRIAGKTEFRTFSSVDECIMYMGSLLKRNYVGQGLISIGQIGAKYCPTNDPTDVKGTNNIWASKVYNYYKNCAVA